MTGTRGASLGEVERHVLVRRSTLVHVRTRLTGGPGETHRTRGQTACGMTRLIKGKCRQRNSTNKHCNAPDTLPLSQKHQTCYPYMGKVCTEHADRLVGLGGRADKENAARGEPLTTGCYADLKSK